MPNCRYRSGRQDHAMTPHSSISYRKPIKREDAISVSLTISCLRWRFIYRTHSDAADSTLDSCYQAYLIKKRVSFLIWQACRKGAGLAVWKFELIVVLSDLSSLLFPDRDTCSLFCDRKLPQPALTNCISLEREFRQSRASTRVSHISKTTRWAASHGKKLPK